ncbi:uncharacterized protein LOC111702197 isoform X2 [Eurytemora carolleeae]|uniref:uncharacterized protein LOC111702197 isoform X2 n=1 Tax=Eurytemora carolleeae TaxID=1294199 RepID=UPI000C759582|nr:uncharacterized protein LOC111702197 isoform X2 [Eurytemora carolleeae]|eukprot:XP_023329577.1 uncharacterized protein LOC111702197 isoform X2 [Eurytemora affinis]
MATSIQQQGSKKSGEERDSSKSEKIKHNQDMSSKLSEKFPKISITTNISSSFLKPSSTFFKSSSSSASVPSPQRSVSSSFTISSSSARYSSPLGSASSSLSPSEKSRSQQRSSSSVFNTISESSSSPPRSSISLFSSFYKSKSRPSRSSLSFLSSFRESSPSPPRSNSSSLSSSSPPRSTSSLTKRGPPTSTLNLSNLPSSRLRSNHPNPVLNLSSPQKLNAWSSSPPRSISASSLETHSSFQIGNTAQDFGLTTDLQTVSMEINLIHREERTENSVDIINSFEDSDYAMEPMDSDDHMEVVEDIAGDRIQHDRSSFSFNHTYPEQGFPCAQRQYSESLGIISHTGPLHPSYATPEARLRTFREWPPALKQRPQDLADAGFYYIGLSDQVKCFYCDGGLRNWQPEDDPWMEHARWFSKCVFVRLRKGDEYIKECLESRPPDSTQESVPESREVTEEDIRSVMSETLVRQVLSMGIDHSRVKMAIKKQLEDYGAGFDTPENLINAAFAVQRSQERRVTREHNYPSGAVLGGRRSFDEVTSRHWEEGLNQLGDTTEDEDEIPMSFTSLPTGVNLSRSAIRPSTSSLPTPPAPKSSTSAPQTPASPAKSEAAPNSSSEATSSQPPVLPASSSQPSVLPGSSSGLEKEESLEDENARLKEQRTCKVCMDGEVGVVFLPCGHLICCVSCAPSLKDCPVCRCGIQGTVRTFLS